MERKLQISEDERLRRQGEALADYLKLSEEEGGPQPPTDNETSRPSPLKPFTGKGGNNG